MKMPVLLLCCIAASALLVGCGPKASAIQSERFPVKKVDLRDVMSQSGEVQPVVKVDLKTEASGRIERIRVKAGQLVQKGDTILTIDPQRLRVRLERLDLAIEAARIQLRQAQDELSRAETLALTGSVSGKDLQNAQNGASLADISLRQQMLDRKDVLDELSKTVVTAPMTGVLTTLDVDEGEIAVSATSGMQAGTAVGTIADIKKLEVISAIGEVDYVHLKLGQKVVVRPQAFENVSTSGTVTFVALSAKKNGQDLGTFEVRVSVDSILPGIAPGINVNVDYVLLEKKDVLGVPCECVQKSREGYTAMVADPTGKAPPRKTRVELGATDFKNWEVLSGLKEGDQVLAVEQKRAGGPGGMGGGPGGRH
jgi:HlyD family secretion protein